MGFSRAGRVNEGNGSGSEARVDSNIVSAVSPGSSPQIGGLGDQSGVSKNNEGTEGTKDYEEGEIVSTEVEHGEAIVPRQVPEVYTPTKQEIDEHNISHLPFRSWRRHCVEGRSVDRSSSGKYADGSVGCVPCVHFDYMFMGASDSDDCTPILVVMDDKTESVFANVVPSKGFNDFVIDIIMEDIDMMGHTEIILKADNEPSTLAVQDQVKAKRPHKTILEIPLGITPSPMGS